MDDLVEEFLVETKDGLEALDNDLVNLEQNPTDKEIIGNIFRIMHTIKGTCGFLGLGRLESIAHAGENILDKIRDGKIKISPVIISTIFASVDKIKELVEALESTGEEPAGDDSTLINKLNECAEGKTSVSPAPAKQEENMLRENEHEASDSDELQRIFNETKTEVDVGQYHAEKAPAEEEKVQKIAYDSAELQRLFDETTPEVDVGQYTPKISSSPAPAQNKPKEVAHDSNELQKIFDETKTEVDVGQYNHSPSEKAKPSAAHDTAHDKDNKDKKSTSSAASATQSIRVNLDVLEELMQQASELVLTRNQLMQLLRGQENSIFSTALQQLNHITTEIQEGVMKTRMQPVGSAWAKLPRIVRDLANELNKKIDLVMEGEETELDRQLLEMIKDPLTHMVRNSADHGLEKPAERIKRGKPETGTINLKAYHGGGFIIIEISDDGNGIDPKKIKSKAIEKGLVASAEAENMSDSQILQFIFSPGFSTAEKITSVSGRGVGMDVVKNNIEKISGTVDLKSTLGKGSLFTIKIPLTLAIMPVLEVQASGQHFAIPQINIIEIVRANGKNNSEIEQIDHKPVLRLRNKILPLISLSEVLQIGKCTLEKGKAVFIIVCEVGGYSFGVIVDGVYDTEEIVVKPTAPIIKNLDIYSGCTILGNGNVIMILDPNVLARATGETTGLSQHHSANERNSSSTEQLSSFVMFKAGDNTPKVVPLELVSRLEDMDISNVEYSHGMPVIQYRGSLMRVAKFDSSYELPKTGIQEMLVFINGKKIMGLAVDEISDIVSAPAPENISDGKDGFLGSIVIDGKTCDIIDASYYFNALFSDYKEEKPKQEKRINQSKRLLLIDDSPFFRKFIPPELNVAGYDTVVMSSALEALDMLNHDNNFTAIVTDINMPEMDGRAFLNLCKMDEKLQNIPIIALSANTDINAAGNSIDSEFSAIVSKTSHTELIEILDKVINTRSEAA